ncbi:MAG: hypothetical protein COU35_03560 [Candidatus Magasanikbacteria bacterium CG10_big_fil_rev_8_21_14_0_10_47_10]|uniref:Uncharacterized protein n=1 Tax=Candidatus Magasanikbacteria bacterium CG10_big_fil_rev_8_21_14_0_10_47_10 TaxID=1974652 RepID=A0A2H0TQ26_9BACT|nr:MAG: hypothetical protein COU35_03560 [Candidatus Magasanikbacteria bacterium CG10_big_fil_rev_8_21_14_0_10_47_10]
MTKLGALAGIAGFFAVKILWQSLIPDWAMILLILAPLAGLIVLMISLMDGDPIRIRRRRWP